ncbi:MAG: hypothetical protein ACFFDS_08810 [Candidatus Thorarchaeota archaeon]
MDELEKMENLSTNLLITSIPFVETDQGLFTTVIMTGEEVTQDVSTIMQLEEAKESINILDEFPDKEIIFKSSKYEFIDASEDKSKTPSLYLIKQDYNEISLLNIIISPISELNLSKTSEVIDYIAQSISGVFRRTNTLRNNDSLSEEEQRIELRKNLRDLVEFYQWQILSEQSLQKSTEQVAQAPMITNSLLIKAEIIRDQVQCMGSCGKTFSKETTPSGVQCECGGEIVIAPPSLNLAKVSYVYPKGLKEIINNDDAITPNSLLMYVKESIMSPKLLTSLNQLSSLKFHDYISIPSILIYKSKLTNDLINVHLDYFQNSDDEIFIFACTTDTRFSDQRLVSAISLPIIMRTFRSTFQGEDNWKEVIQRSELKDWMITPFVKIKTLNQFPSLSDILALEIRRDNNE